MDNMTRNFIKFLSFAGIMFFISIFLGDPKIGDFYIHFIPELICVFYFGKFIRRFFLSKRRIPNLIASLFFLSYPTAKYYYDWFGKTNITNLIFIVFFSITGFIGWVVEDRNKIKEGR